MLSAEAGSDMIVIKRRQDVVDGVLRAVYWHMGISPSSILGSSRTREIVDARHLAMWLLRKHNNKSSAWSFPQIGASLGGKHHTTIIHGIRKVDAAIAAGESWAVVALEIEREIFGEARKA